MLISVDLFDQYKTLHLNDSCQDSTQSRNQTQNAGLFTAQAIYCYEKQKWVKVALHTFTLPQATAVESAWY